MDAGCVKDECGLNMDKRWGLGQWWGRGKIGFGPTEGMGKQPADKAGQRLRLQRQGWVPQNTGGEAAGGTLAAIARSLS